MLRPANYLNLFDFLFPQALLTGLPDASQITVEAINQQLAIVQTNLRSLYRSMNSVVTEADEGSFFSSFMLPFSEVAAAQGWSLSPAQLANAQFTTGFDAVGEGISFSTPQTVYYMNNLGGLLTGDTTIVLAFSGGLLVDQQYVTVRVVQGGIIVYLDSTQVQPYSPVWIVILRQFNRIGQTWTTAPEWSFSASTPGPLQLTVTTMTSLGNIYDISTYRLFTKLPGDSYYRPLDPSTYTGRFQDVGDGALFTYTGNAAAGQAFMLVGGGSYFEYTYEGTGTSLTSQQFSIPLVESDGVTPCWATCASDADVWLNGQLLRHDVDYTYDPGCIADPTQPPRLLVGAAPLGAFRIRAIVNAPFDPANGVTVEGPDLPDPRGLVVVPKEGRGMRLLSQVGMLFSGGLFVGWGLDETIGENKALDLSALWYDNDYFYRARFCNTPDSIAVSRQANSLELGLEKFIDLLNLPTGPTGTDGQPSADGRDGATGPWWPWNYGQLFYFDWLTSYANSKGITGIAGPPTGATGSASFPPPFGAGYFWARDRLAADLANGNVAFDCRNRGYNPLWESWAQPTYAQYAAGAAPIGPTGPSGPTGNTGYTGPTPGWDTAATFDCRPTAYTQVALDFRGAA